MNEENNLANGEFTRYKEVNFLVNTIPQNKFIINRLRIGYFIATTAFVVFESIFSLSFNPIFFFLSMLKFMVAFSSVLFFGYLVIGNSTHLTKFQDKTTRKKEFVGRILHLLKDIGIMFIILSTIFGIIHITGLPKYIEGNFQTENPALEFPLSYQPISLELVLIILIIITLLLSLFTLNYWIYSRCTQYIGYNEDKKILKLNIPRALIGYCINAIIFGILLTFILDDLFVATKFPDIIASWDKFDTFFASNAYILLIIELTIIVILNSFFIIDGFLANKFRKNFVEE
ncbi:MAG: hypothetical protein ACTSSK_08790 [Candidatus Heimdallarchaeota archaeon]